MTVISFKSLQKLCLTQFIPNTMIMYLKSLYFYFYYKNKINRNRYKIQNTLTEVIISEKSQEQYFQPSLNI